MKKKKNVAASLFRIPLDLENIGYQFRTIEDTRDWIPKEEGGWTKEEWKETRFAKIIISDKTGSTSLRGLENENTTLSIQDKIDWDTLINGYLICLIRDPIGKYKSSIKEKYLEHLSNTGQLEVEEDFLISIGLVGTDNDNPYWNKAKLIPTFVDNNLPEVDFFMKFMILKHEIDNDLSWMSQGNTIFWYWNNPQWESYDYIAYPDGLDPQGKAIPIHTKWNLYTFLLEPNVYFLELKHLSDPKFLKWLQRKDDCWKSINEIHHSYKTKKSFYENYDLFWKEYSEGKILQDKCLVNPLYNLKTNLKSDYIKRLCKILEIENYLIDHIRNDHDRYLSKTLEE